MSDYPNALWVPAHNSNYRTAFRESYSLVVIHCTDGHARAEPVAEMWQQPHHGSSAHFVIDQDGSVIQAVRLKDIAWHAHTANERGVGVEFCARSPHEWSPHDMGLPLSDAQYLSGARLVAWLLTRAGLPANRDSIKGHAEADPDTTHLDCPFGAGFQMDRFLGLVQREMEQVT